METINHEPEFQSNEDTMAASVTEIGSDSSPVQFDGLLKNPKFTLKTARDILQPIGTHFSHDGANVTSFSHDGGQFRSASPVGSLRSSFGNNTRRRVSRRSHFHGGYSNGHGGYSSGYHSEVSKELTQAAESEFFALMELMSSMSRRSSSLKEIWMKLISERETHYEEMDRMYERIEEYTEIIEKNERESHGHVQEHEERKKELVKLRLEISVAIAASAEWKRKFHDRDGDLGKAKSRISELEDLYKYSEERYDESKTTLEQTKLQLVAALDRCEHAEADARKHELEVDSWKSNYSKLQTSSAEVSSKYKSSLVEISSLKTQNETHIKERNEWQHKKGELDDQIRKSGLRVVELKDELEEITSNLTKKKRELHESEDTLRTTTETLNKTKHLLEESEGSVTKKKREYQELLVRFNDTEDRYRKLDTKCQHFVERITSLEQTIIKLESERTTLQETINELKATHAELTTTYEKLQSTHHATCKESSDRQRLILVHVATISRLEHLVKEKTEAIHTLHERTERLTTDLEYSQSTVKSHLSTLSDLKATLATQTVTLDAITAERDDYLERLTTCELQYTQLCTWRDDQAEGSSAFEYEISSLRSMLREVREEREAAIRRREQADHERDEATAKYEAKCRELDRVEESWSRMWSERAQSSHHHHHSKSGLGMGGHVRIFSQTLGSVRGAGSVREGGSVRAAGSVVGSGVE